MIITFFSLSQLQDLVGLLISILLLADFSLVLLSLLQMYSISLLNFFLVLFILPLGLVFPFPAGISALFSHGPRRSAGLARVYALWNLTSFINVVSIFCQCLLNCRIIWHNFLFILWSPVFPNYICYSVYGAKEHFWIVITYLDLHSTYRLSNRLHPWLSHLVSLHLHSIFISLLFLSVMSIDK